MYSSCPNIIKHFVPMKFSFASMDHAKQPKIQANDPEKYEMPLTNMKLQCLKQKPKDFVLIFKNKSYKQYSPRKQVRYSPLLKQMKKINNQVEEDMVEMDQKSQVNGEWTRNIVSSNANEWKTARQACHSVDRARRFQIQWRRTHTSATKTRFRVQTKQSSAKQSRNNFKIVKEGEQRKIRQRKKSVKLEQQNQQIKNLLQFKIKGSRAPKSETVDFFKKLNLDINFHLAGTLFK